MPHDLHGFFYPETVALIGATDKPDKPGTAILENLAHFKGAVYPVNPRHETLLGWCTLLAKAPAGHVVVCQPNNHEIALMGELSAQTLAARGVLGYVVDGGSRDTEHVLAQGFPVFCSFLTPADIAARWIPDSFGAPIRIGDVVIATGDYLLGDRDGVVIVPQAIAEDVVAKTEEVVATESEMRAALIGGMDPVAAYNRYGKF